MSLDGYIAKDDNTIGRLFDWLQNGDVEVPTTTGSGNMTFRLSEASARYCYFTSDRSTNHRPIASGATTQIRLVTPRWAQSSPARSPL